MDYIINTFNFGYQTTVNSGTSEILMQ